MTNILSQVLKEILEDQQTSDEKIIKYMKKYPVLCEKHPKSINLACETTSFNEREKVLLRFEYLINMKSNIESNIISQHDGDVTVGELLVNDYIKNVVK